MWRGWIYGTCFRGRIIVRVYCDFNAERPVRSPDRSNRMSRAAMHAARSFILIVP